jgi:uncharacterized membrane protein YhaH (DUF805 family)
MGTTLDWPLTVDDQDHVGQEPDLICRMAIIEVVIGLGVALALPFMVINRNANLIAIICLIPFSIIPYEITRHSFNLNYLWFLSVLILGARFRVFSDRFDKIECLLLLLGLYIIVDLAIAPIFSPGSVSPWLHIGQEGAKFISALVFYRVAKRREAATAIVNGIALSLIIISALGFYQIHEGLTRLIGLGYVPPNFSYGTASGQMRPFGPFDGPPVFGDHLATMLGFLLWANWTGSQGSRFIRAVALVIGGAALISTETRASWIAFVIGAAVVYLVQPKRFKRHYLPRIGWLAAALSTLAVVLPRERSTVVARLGTLFQSGYTSNADRAMLWRGTLDAAMQSVGHFFFGYGTESFPAVLSAYISITAASLGQAHDSYLEILYLYGVIALLLYLLVLWPVFSALIRRTRGRAEEFMGASAALGALVVFVVDSLFDNLWTEYDSLVMVFLMVGVGLSVKAASRSGNPKFTYIDRLYPDHSKP